MMWTRIGDIAMKDSNVISESAEMSIASDGVISTNGRNAYGAQEIIARSSFLVFFCSLSWSSSSDVVPILVFFLSS